MARKSKVTKHVLEEYSHQSELKQALESFDSIEARHPDLKKAIAPVRRNINLRLDPTYTRITPREQMDIMTEVNLIHQADSDMTQFKDKPDVQRKIISRVNKIGPKL